MAFYWHLFYHRHAAVITYLLTFALPTKNGY